MWRGDSEGTVRCGEGTVRCGEGTENSIPCNNEICGKVRGFFSPFSSMEWPGLSVQGAFVSRYTSQTHGNTKGSTFMYQEWQHHRYMCQHLLPTCTEVATPQNMVLCLVVHYTLMELLFTFYENTSDYKTAKN